jgi:hypothetical protein
LVQKGLVRKIRKRFNQLYDDIVGEGYDERDVQEIIDGLEDNLLDELDGFEEE